MSGRHCRYEVPDGPDDDVEKTRAETGAQFGESGWREKGPGAVRRRVAVGLLLWGDRRVADRICRAACLRCRP